MTMTFEQQILLQGRTDGYLLRLLQTIRDGNAEDARVWGVRLWGEVLDFMTEEDLEDFHFTGVGEMVAPDWRIS